VGVIEMMFCKYCHHQTKMIVSDPRYEIGNNIKQIRKVSCAECRKFLHDAIKKYDKDTPVSLITGEITQSQLKRLKSERALVKRIVEQTFLKPQLRCWKIGSTVLKNRHVERTLLVANTETTINSEYEMIEDTPKTRRYERFRAWEALYFTDDKGKRHRRSQPKEEPEKEKAWCNQLTRGQPTDNGELGKLHKHGMEKIQDFVLGMGSKTKVRVCVEGRWEKAGISIRKNGKEVLTQKWIETWRDYIPLDIIPTDITQDANLDEIKYCGFGQCPNRYAYITRPDKLEEVFGESNVKEEIIKPVRNIWSGEMVTTSYL
jgi:hypothetical protein